MTKLNIVLAALTGYATASSQSSLQTATRIAGVESQGKQLEASSTWESYTEDGTWGFTLQVSYDLSIGYDAAVLSFKEDEMTFIAVNPTAFIKLWTGIEFSITTSLFVAKIFSEFTPAQFIPLDF